jgi:hypothetical protein
MHMVMLTLAAVVVSAPGAPAAPVAPNPHPVIELRQYKILPGKRDAMIDLFDSRFVESQEALGAQLVGQFRDRDGDDRFTWIRGFSSMDTRAKALNDFYFGPVWQAHRADANTMLDDNDNVLLLKPAWSGSGFAAPTGTRAAIGSAAPPGGVIIATIEYLWKEPGQGFSDFFKERLAPALREAGLPVIASYVAEDEPNNFPRLHVRQGERVFVWFARAASPAEHQAAQRRLTMSAKWQATLQPALSDFEERPPQVLMLLPTARSLLR